MKIANSVDLIDIIRNCRFYTDSDCDFLDYSDSGINEVDKEKDEGE